MKTAEEIKKGLECCDEQMSCDECPYHGENDCSYLVVKESRSYIQQLEAERDAIMSDFKLYRDRNISGKAGAFACDLCKHGGEYYECDGTKCPEDCDGMNHWQWRGVQKEEHDE